MHYVFLNFFVPLSKKCFPEFKHRYISCYYDRSAGRIRTRMKHLVILKAAMSSAGSMAALVMASAGIGAVV